MTNTDEPLPNTWESKLLYVKDLQLTRHQLESTFAQQHAYLTELHSLNSGLCYSIFILSNLTDCLRQVYTCARTHHTDPTHLIDEAILPPLIPTDSLLEGVTVPSIYEGFKWLTPPKEEDTTEDSSSKQKNLGVALQNHRDITAFKFKLQCEEDNFARTHKLLCDTASLIDEQEIRKEKLQAKYTQQRQSLMDSACSLINKPDAPPETAESGIQTDPMEELQQLKTLQAKHNKLRHQSKHLHCRVETSEMQREDCIQQLFAEKHSLREAVEEEMKFRHRDALNDVHKRFEQTMRKIEDAHIHQLQKQKECSTTETNARIADLLSHLAHTEEELAKESIVKVQMCEQRDKAQREYRIMYEELSSAKGAYNKIEEMEVLLEQRDARIKRLLKQVDELNNPTTVASVGQFGSISNGRSSSSGHAANTKVMSIDEETKQYEKQIIQNARDAYNISGGGNGHCTDVDELILDSIMDEWSSSDDYQENADMNSRNVGVRLYTKGKKMQRRKMKEWLQGRRLKEAKELTEMRKQPVIKGLLHNSRPHNTCRTQNQQQQEFVQRQERWKANVLQWRNDTRMENLQQQVDDMWKNQVKAIPQSEKILKRRARDDSELYGPVTCWDRRFANYMAVRSPTKSDSEIDFFRPNINNASRNMFRTDKSTTVYQRLFAKAHTAANTPRSAVSRDEEAELGSPRPSTGPQATREEQNEIFQRVIHRGEILQRRTKRKVDKALKEERERMSPQLSRKSEKMARKMGGRRPVHEAATVAHKSRAGLLKPPSEDGGPGAVFDPISFFHRQDATLKRKERVLREERKEQALKEKEECTFKPKILKKSEHIAAKAAANIQLRTQHTPTTTRTFSAPSSLLSPEMWELYGIPHCGGGGRAGGGLTPQQSMSSVYSCNNSNNNRSHQYTPITLTMDDEDDKSYTSQHSQDVADSVMLVLDSNTSETTDASGSKGTINRLITPPPQPLLTSYPHSVHARHHHQHQQQQEVRHTTVHTAHHNTGTATTADVACDVRRTTAQQPTTTTTNITSPSDTTNTFYTTYTHSNDPQNVHNKDTSTSVGSTPNTTHTPTTFRTPHSQSSASQSTHSHQQSQRSRRHSQTSAHSSISTYTNDNNLIIHQAASACSTATSSPTDKCYTLQELVSMEDGSTRSPAMPLSISTTNNSNTSTTAHMPISPQPTPHQHVFVPPNSEYSKIAPSSSNSSPTPSTSITPLNTIDIHKVTTVLTPRPSSSTTNNTPITQNITPMSNISSSQHTMSGSMTTTNAIISSNSNPTLRSITPTSSVTPPPPPPTIATTSTEAFRLTNTTTPTERSTTPTISTADSMHHKQGAQQQQVYKPPLRIVPPSQHQKPYDATVYTPTAADDDEPSNLDISSPIDPNDASFDQLDELHNELMAELRDTKQLHEVLGFSVPPTPSSITLDNMTSLPTTPHTATQTPHPEDENKPTKATAAPTRREIDNDSQTGDTTRVSLVHTPMSCESNNTQAESSSPPLPTTTPTQHTVSGSSPQTTSSSMPTLPSSSRAALRLGGSSSTSSVVTVSSLTNTGSEDTKEREEREERGTNLSPTAAAMASAYQRFAERLKKLAPASAAHAQHLAEQEKKQ